MEGSPGKAPPQPWFQPLHKIFAMKRSSGKTPATDTAKDRIIFDGVLTVTVGEQYQKVFVHKSVLGARSSFFCKTMKPERASMRPDPETIAMSHYAQKSFAKYIHWLHFKTIPVDDVEEPTREGFEELARAYVLGEELMDVKFKNAMVDVFICISQASSKVPQGRALTIIFDGTLPNSPARRLMLDFYAYQLGDTEHWGETLGESSKEVLLDVVKALAKTQGCTVKQEKPWNRLDHLYHEKEDESA